ncbi:MAG: carboxypeptidase regulatory-like domain-containing protein, partial [Chitinispirillaceae bacterium]|nr:carboxypeptidase regulatory-like domain-containing protein [Chitinispirillaceae bacterium]
MNNRVRQTLCCAFSLAAMALLRCVSLIGGGTEDVNSLTGVVYAPDNRPATGVQVTCIPFDYNPAADGPIPDSLKDTTGSDGVYRITIPDAGTYNIEAVALTGRERSLITGIVVPGDKDT